jgi:hypothetical protein
MTHLDLALLIGFEVVGLLLIARLWLRKSKVTLTAKILLTLVLLIPLLGIIGFMLVSLDPSPHGEDPGDRFNGVP